MQKSQVECEQPSEEQSHEEDMPQSWPSFMHRAQQSPHCDGDADRPAEEDVMERFQSSSQVKSSQVPQVSQSVSQLFHGPAPRSPLHRLAVRLRHSRSNTSTEYSLPGATQLSQVRSISPSGQGDPSRF